MTVKGKVVLSLHVLCWGRQSADSSFAVYGASKEGSELELSCGLHTLSGSDQRKPYFHRIMWTFSM